jgi:type III secretion system (T3SS) SseB-like protein
MPKPDLKNTELLQAMAGMLDAEHDNAKLRALYRALRGAMVVVVSGKTSMALDEDKELFVRTYEDESGREILIAYTGFDVAPADLPGSVTPLVELCKQVAPLGLAIHINPGRPHGGIAPANWVRAIAEGATEMPDPAPVLTTRVAGLNVSPADDVKAATRVRLTEALIATHNAVEAYLGYATPDEAPPILTLCVVVVPASLAKTRGHAIAVQLHAWVRPLLGHDEEIDFLVLPEDARLVATFKAVGPPFYRRS